MKSLMIFKKKAGLINLVLGLLILSTSLSNILTSENAQAEDSITLDWMFRTSLRLNRGDVYSTLLTIENVLARHFLTHDRESLPVTRRLQSFTHGTGNELDRFGMWYHFFGIMLYGYSTPYPYEWLQAVSVGEFETLGAGIISENRNIQKRFINIQGGIIGQLLRKAVLQEQWKKMEPNPDLLKKKHYLRK